MFRMKTALFACAVAAAQAMTAASPAQALDKLTIVVFGPPSLGAFLPPIIKAQKFDEKNGLSIDFQQRPPTAYTSQFNSGEFQVGGSAALLTVGLADLRGVKVTYLFNLFDYWGTVVSSRTDVKSLKDLEGKDLAAAKATTNFRMFEWLAKQQGVDVGKIKVLNTAPPGLVGYALADRAAAVQLWEPAYTILKSKKPSIHSIDLKINQSWKKATGGTNIPYLGVAVHTEWANKNAHLIPKLYAAYKAAAAWVTAHPDEAGKFAGAVRQNLPLMKARFLSAREFLNAQPSVDPEKNAAIGYCFGGSVVLEMAIEGVDLAGVASFHGSLGGLSTPAKGAVKARVLVANGADDPFTTAEQIAAFKTMMDAAGADYTFINYPGAKHSFTNPDADELGKKFNLPLAYNAAADKDSWQQATVFLREVFSGK